MLLVVRAGRDECGELRSMLTGWEGHLTVLLRKRVYRHIERCTTCTARRAIELRPAMLLDLSPGAALAAGDRATLQRLIHQCRGAGRSYGFAPISQHAADAEEALLAGAALPAVEPMVRRLVAYIEEIEGYGQSPPPGDPAGGAAGVSR